MGGTPISTLPGTWTPLSSGYAVRHAHRTELKNICWQSVTDKYMLACTASKPNMKRYDNGKKIGQPLSRALRMFPLYHSLGRKPLQTTFYIHSWEQDLQVHPSAVTMCAFRDANCFQTLAWQEIRDLVCGAHTDRCWGRGPNRPILAVVRLLHLCVCCSCLISGSIIRVVSCAPVVRRLPIFCVAFLAGRVSLPVT